MEGPAPSSATSSSTRRTATTTFERNIAGCGTGRDWYPNLRGFGNTGRRNVARDNVGWWEDRLILNTKAESGNRADYGIVDAVGTASGWTRGSRTRPAARGSSHAGLRRSPTGMRPRSSGSRDQVASRPPWRCPRRRSPVLGQSAPYSSPRADAYPDALAGAPLAATLGAPVLLTTSASLHPAARAEVRRLGARTAFLLGGPAALSPQMEADLRAAGVGSTERIAGVDRLDTARLNANHAYVVEGANPDPNRGWPDAVAVSSLAAQTQRPILLVPRDRLPQPTQGVLLGLQPQEVTVIGGTAAVSGRVAQRIGEATPDAMLHRLADVSQYDTSLEWPVQR